MLFCLSFASLDAHEGEAKQAGGMWQTGFRICETNKLELRGGYYVTHFLKCKEISTNRHIIITKKMLTETNSLTTSQERDYAQ